MRARSNRSGSGFASGWNDACNDARVVRYFLGSIGLAGDGDKGRAFALAKRRPLSQQEPLQGSEYKKGCTHGKP
jgi:hypothetical protein